MASSVDPSHSQRRNSMTEPPEMSELRIVLLGKNSSEISRVGNFILNRAAFDIEAPPPSIEQHSERARGNVEGRYITLINTPHLFDPSLSLDQLTVQVKECMSLCSPGPHVVVLVLQPEDFTETDRDRLHHIYFSLSEEAHKYTLTLTIQALPSGITEDPVQEDIIQKIVQCSSRCFEFSSECSRSDLMEVMEKMFDENGGSCFKWEEYEEATLVDLPKSMLPESVKSNREQVTELLEEIDRRKREEEERKQKEDEQRRMETERVRRVREDRLRVEERVRRELEERLQVEERVRTEREDRLRVEERVRRETEERLRQETERARKEFEERLRVEERVRTERQVAMSESRSPCHIM